jgi:hypothetical protein
MTGSHLDTIGRLSCNTSGRMRRSGRQESDNMMDRKSSESENGADGMMQHCTVRFEIDSFTQSHSVLHEVAFSVPKQCGHSCYSETRSRRVGGRPVVGQAGWLSAMFDVLMSSTEGTTDSHSMQLSSFPLPHGLSFVTCAPSRPPLTDTRIAWTLGV